MLSIPIFCQNFKLLVVKLKLLRKPSDFCFCVRLISRCWLKFMKNNKLDCVQAGKFVTSKDVSC